MTAFPGTQHIADAATDFAATNAAIVRMLSLMGTPMPVKVVAVKPGAVGPIGTVDVQIQVHQMNSLGEGTPHGTIYGVPYFRYQGGKFAVIIDPQVGDIGTIIVCGRDISNVKATGAAALPASFRKHSYADAIYMGCIIGPEPTDYVKIDENGIEIVSTVKVTMTAPEIDINGPVKVAGSITATGDVVGGSVSLESHVHSGVQSGGSDTGEPVG